MPAEQGLRLDDQQRLAPGADPTGEQYEERPISRCATRALDAAPEDDELMAQEGLLRGEGRSAAREVGEQALPERASKGSSETSTTAEQTRQHRSVPQRVQTVTVRYP